MNSRDTLSASHLVRLVAILAAIAVTFVVLAGGGAAVYYAQARLLDYALVVVGLGAWLVVTARWPTVRPASALTPVLALTAASFALSAVLSRNPRIGLEYAAITAILCALYLLFVVMLRSPVVRARILATIPILCIVIATAYVVLVVADWVSWWDALGRLQSPPLRPRYQGLTYGNPNTVMALVVLLFASTVATLGLAGRRGVVLIAIGILAIGASFLTGSRGGLIGLAAGFGAIVVVAGMLDRQALMERLRGFRHARMALALAMMSAVTIGILFGPTLIGRLTAGGTELRGSFALASLRGFAESPMTGIGPGMWPVDRPRFTADTDLDYYIPHAHNIVTQTLSEFGILGVLVTLLGAWTLLPMIRRALREPDATIRRWGYAATFCLAYLAGHDQVDLFANVPAVLFAGALPIAILDASTDHRRTRLRAVVAPVLVVVGIVAGICLVIVEGTALRYEQAVEQADAGDWPSSAASFEDIARSDPALPIHQLALGLARARVDDLDGAAAAFAAGAQGDDFAVSWLGLAAVQLRLGRADEAATSLDRAYRLGRQAPMVAFGIGQLRLELGDEVGAGDAFGWAMARAPTLAGDPSWRTRQELAASFDRAVAVAKRAIGREPEQLFELALAVGDTTAALALVAEMEDQPAAAVVVEAVASPSAGYPALVAYADREASDLADSWVIRLASITGDRETIDRTRRRVDAVNAFSPIFGLVVRISDADPWESLRANDSNIFHGLYTYRRPTPQDYLVPWLSHLRWTENLPQG